MSFFKNALKEVKETSWGELRFWVICVLSTLFTLAVTILLFDEFADKAYHNSPLQLIGVFLSLFLFCLLFLLMSGITAHFRENKRACSRPE